MNYALTPSAKTDLEKILSHIAQDNPEESRRLEANIYEACELLTTYPTMGSKRPAWPN